jgi:hypothetical protein
MSLNRQRRGAVWNHDIAGRRIEWEGALAVRKREPEGNRTHAPLVQAVHPDSS